MRKKRQGDIIFNFNGSLPFSNTFIFRGLLPTFVKIKL
jgi:hypothetical protein